MNATTGQDTARAPGPPRPRAQVIPLLLAVSGWAVLGIVDAQAPTALRVIAVFAFILICPGAALTRFLPVRDLLERAVLAVAIGVSLAALVGEATALGRPASASLVLVVLALVCTAAAVAEIARGERARWRA